MSFGALEGERIQEALPAVMAWIAQEINTRERAVNWAINENGSDAVPAPWKVIDGTYKTFPEEADFYPGDDPWWSISYAGYFLYWARTRICHLIGAEASLTGPNSIQEVGGPAGTAQGDFDPAHNAYFMTGDWIPWGSSSGNVWGSNIRTFLQAIGYEDGRWISEALELSPTLTIYVDTPAHDPRKWYQLRDAIEALRWFRVLHCNFIEKERQDIEITQSDAPESEHDIVYHFRQGAATGNNPPDAAQLLALWEEAWDAQDTDVVFEFAPLCGVQFVLRTYQNLDTPDQYDYRAFFRVETVGKYRMKLGYLENFHGTVVGNWIFSWRIVDQEYLELTDSYGNVYSGENDSPSPYHLVVNSNPGSALTLGAENHAELYAAAGGFPLELGDNAQTKSGGFVLQGQKDTETWIGQTDLSLKCEI